MKLSELSWAEWLRIIGIIGQVACIVLLVLIFRQCGSAFEDGAPIKKAARDLIHFVVKEAEKAKGCE